MEQTYPPTCPNGHPPRPGYISYSWVSCRCPGEFGGGHHVRYCRVRVNGEDCRAYDYPAEHVGPEPDQR